MALRKGDHIPMRQTHCTFSVDIPRERHFDFDLPDDIAAQLFTVKPELCEKPFELKIDNERYVGYPTNIDEHNSEIVSRYRVPQTLFVVVLFVLKVTFPLLFTTKPNVILHRRLRRSASCVHISRSADKSQWH